MGVDTCGGLCDGVDAVVLGRSGTSVVDLSRSAYYLTVESLRQQLLHPPASLPMPLFHSSLCLGLSYRLLYSPEYPFHTRPPSSAQPPSPPLWSLTSQSVTHCT